MAENKLEGLPPGIQSLLELTEGKYTIHVPEVALQIDGAAAATLWRAHLIDVGTHPENHPDVNLDEFDSFCTKVAMMIDSGMEDVVLEP